MSKPKAIVERITLHCYEDPDPDLSWLDADSGRNSDVVDEVERARYDAEDADRLASFGDSWWMVGLRATAHIRFDHGGTAHVGTTVDSGGLWSIESDSDPGYFLSVWQEQVSDLVFELGALGLGKQARKAPVEIVSTTDNPEPIGSGQYSMVDQ